MVTMNFAALASRLASIAPNKYALALPLSIMLLLYWLSSLPGVQRPEDPALFAVFYWISPSLQNLLHIPAYAVLSLAWHWALVAWLRADQVQAYVACIIGSLYGVFDEWHQSFVPGRFASIVDALLDVAGAALGVWIALRLREHAQAYAINAGTIRAQK
jgi:hypothetical protein